MTNPVIGALSDGKSIEQVRELAKSGALGKDTKTINEYLGMLEDEEIQVWLGTLAQIENDTFDIDRKNPTSTARGVFQFTDPTTEDMLAGSTKFDPHARLEDYGDAAYVIHSLAVLKRANMEKGAINDLKNHKWDALHKKLEVAWESLPSYGDADVMYNGRVLQKRTQAEFKKLYEANAEGREYVSGYADLSGETLEEAIMDKIEEVGFEGKTGEEAVEAYKLYSKVQNDINPKIREIKAKYQSQIDGEDYDRWMNLNYRDELGNSYSVKERMDILGDAFKTIESSTDKNGKFVNMNRPLFGDGTPEQVVKKAREMVRVNNIVLAKAHEQRKENFMLELEAPLAELGDYLQTDEIRKILPSEVRQGYLEGLTDMEAAATSMGDNIGDYEKIKFNREKIREWATAEKRRQKSQKEDILYFKNTGRDPVYRDYINMTKERHGPRAGEIKQKFFDESTWITPDYLKKENWDNSLETVNRSMSNLDAVINNPESIGNAQFKDFVTDEFEDPVSKDDKEYYNALSKDEELSKSTLFPDHIRRTDEQKWGEYGREHMSEWQAMAKFMGMGEEGEGMVQNFEITDQVLNTFSDYDLDVETDYNKVVDIYNRMASELPDDDPRKLKIVGIIEGIQKANKEVYKINKDGSSSSTDIADAANTPPTMTEDEFKEYLDKVSGQREEAGISKIYKHIGDGSLDTALQFAGMLGSYKSATAPLPKQRKSEDWKNHMRELSDRRNLGLDAATLTYYQRNAERVYSHDVENISRFGTSGQAVLASLGRAARDKYDAQLKISALDEEAKQKHFTAYGQGLAQDEAMTQSYWQRNVSDPADRKRELKAAIIGQLTNNLREDQLYARQYGEGSYYANLMDAKYRDTRESTITKRASELKLRGGTLPDGTDVDYSNAQALKIAEAENPYTPAKHPTSLTQQVGSALLGGAKGVSSLIDNTQGVIPTVASAISQGTQSIMEKINAPVDANDFTTKTVTRSRSGKRATRMTRRDDGLPRDKWGRIRDKQ